MKLRMREETKGRYDFGAGQREDGARLSRIKLKMRGSVRNVTRRDATDLVWTFLF